MTPWNETPQAIALFDLAYDICGDGRLDFPYSIEADLEALCDGAWEQGGECVISAWEKYCGNRDAAFAGPLLGYLAENVRLGALL